MPELDGLRGMAILLVLLYHFVDRYPIPHASGELIFYKTAEAGWVGVELFFVLSGYLITGILADTRGSRRFFTSFYGRRALRIFPLYYVVLALYFWVGPLLSESLAAHYAPMRNHQAWFWLYGANWLFATTDENIPALYFWSLAVEEQFYLLWPCLVWLCTPRTMLKVSAGLALGSLAVRLLLLDLFDMHAESGYYMTVTHMEGLTIGACIALYSRLYGISPHRMQQVRAALAMSVLAILTLALVDRGFSFWSQNVGGAGYTLLAVAFGSLLILATRSGPRSITRRIFSRRFLRAAGKYSYAMYLFHVPISNLVQLQVFDRLIPRAQVAGSPGSYFLTLAAFIVISGLLSCFAAIVSWNVFEKPLLSLKRFLPY